MDKHSHQPGHQKPEAIRKITQEAAAEIATLKRSLGLPLLVFYGLGTTIGAGIFVLVGRVAGHAGLFAPMAFLIASLLALATAFSFAELSARLPHAAGVALYIREGLGALHLGRFAGLLIGLTALISAAAIVNGAVGYFQELFALERNVLILLLVALLGLVAAWGIVESVGVAAFFTVVEIGGLLLVIGAARGALGDLPLRAGELLPPADILVWSGIFSGSFLAFYAFLGFEDMISIVEEVKDAPRLLPRGIFITLFITVLLYVLVSLCAVLLVPPAELAQSSAPLTLLYTRAGGSGELITVISLFAVLNGALIQVIMAARVFYGMAAKGFIPHVAGRFLKRVHATTRTPLYGTALAAAIVLVLALWFPIEPLARATSALTLFVFTLVNLSLLRLKQKHKAPPGVRSYPIALPALGALVSAAFLLGEIALRFFG